ncbi:MAG: hypothetical protein ACT6S0_05565 [Roseateles sp.]|uniref:hypothetical protein n=1 Tax=Roseateles sp. TaxID=1971397 RepID=UPI00403732AC
MTNHGNNEDVLDDALRAQLRNGGEPDDDGFSLRVMAALPAGVAPQRRRWARWLRWAQWAAISLAACGAAALLAGGNGPLDAPHVVAAVALVGLLMFWSIPSRWSRV